MRQGYGVRWLSWVSCGGLAFFGAGIADATPAREVGSPYVYRFHVDGVLEEAGSSDASSSPYWWMNSGGRLLIKNGIGMTIQGDLPPTDPWRLRYASTTPLHTDAGLHPQNLFRLVTRSRWLNVSQSVSFRITKLNMSVSSERDGWSGILLFNRYLDQDNLYYVGIRQDGSGVIKKKRYGTYYTLAQTSVFRADVAYQRDTTPNLLPGREWTGLRSVVRTQPDSSVLLQLWIDRNRTGQWQKVLETVDTDSGPDGVPILSEGFGGVRTDFMDVELDDYTAERLL